MFLINVYNSIFILILNVLKLYKLLVKFYKMYLKILKEKFITHINTL